MGVFDEGRVVAPDERTVQCGADAHVRLGADHDEPADAETRQHRLEGGVLEGVAVVLLDERLGLPRTQFGDNPPLVAPPGKPFVGVLNPDYGDPFPPRLLYKAGDIGDHRVALVSAVDNPVLDVDDEKRGVGPVAQCAHPLTLYGRARTEKTEVATAAFHAVRLGHKQFGADPFRDIHDRLPVLVQSLPWLVDGDPLAGLEVVVGKAQWIESEDLAGGERINAKLQIPL